MLFVSSKVSCTVVILITIGGVCRGVTLPLQQSLSKRLEMTCVFSCIEIKTLSSNTLLVSVSGLSYFQKV